MDFNSFEVYHIIFIKIGGNHLYVTSEA